MPEISLEPTDVVSLLLSKGIECRDLSELGDTIVIKDCSGRSQASTFALQDGDNMKALKIDRGLHYTLPLPCHLSDLFVSRIDIQACDIYEIAAHAVVYSLAKEIPEIIIPKPEIVMNEGIPIGMLTPWCEGNAVAFNWLQSRRTNLYTAVLKLMSEAQRFGIGFDIYPDRARNYILTPQAQVALIDFSAKGYPNYVKLIAGVKDIPKQLPDNI